MESSSQPVISPTATAVLCPNCHQPVLPSYYFCPNCGAKLQQPPLKTDALTQAWIYFLSLILPTIGFILVSRWPGMKYVKSKDQKAKQIGQTAWFLLIVSTIATVWFAVVWTQNYINQTVSSINADLNSSLGS